MSHESAIFFEFQLSNLYQPYKNLRVKSSEADQEQVSLLEKKLFGAQEELTELHRRRGENAQQIIDQSNQSKEHENRIKQLQDLLEASGMYVIIIEWNIGFLVIHWKTTALKFFNSKICRKIHYLEILNTNMIK